MEIDVVTPEHKMERDYVIHVSNHHPESTHSTFTMLAYSMLKYSRKCTSAGTAGAHFGGYLNN